MNTKWTFPIPNALLEYGFITLAGDDSVYVSYWHPYSDRPYQGRMIVLNPGGTQIYNKHWFLSEQSIGPSGTIYGEDRDEFLSAFYPDGTLKWKRDLSGGGYILGINMQLLVNQQEKIFVSEVLNIGDQIISKFIVLTPDGNIESEDQLSVGQGFALNCDDSIVYVVYGKLYCRTDHLEQIWKIGQEGDFADIYFLGKVVTDQNCRIYCNFCDGGGCGMMALDALGHEIWRVYYPAVNLPAFYSLLARSDTALYVLVRDDASGEVSLCAIHLGGWLLWTAVLEGIYSYDDFADTNEVVVDGADRTYISTGDRLWSYDANGSQRWQVHFPGEQLHALTLSRNGTLYVLGNNQVYAFGV